MSTRFLSDPITSLPATARPGISLAELNALREAARVASDRIARHNAKDCQPDAAERLAAAGDAAFEAYRAAYFAPVILLVCRNADGRQIASQSFTDAAKADRVMVARNRAEMAVPSPSMHHPWARVSDSGHRWGIETTSPASEPATVTAAEGVLS